MKTRSDRFKRWLVFAGTIPFLQLSAVQADVIADSIAEFSGVQGEDGWHDGYRIFYEGESDSYDAATSFVPFNGGSNDPNPWDGFGQAWTGSGWDLNTAAAAPWTFQGPEALHPNGPNNGEPNLNIRRWVASELTETTPLAVTWRTRKENTGGGNGVTGVLYLNGNRIDSAIIAGTDGVGVTRTVYVNADPDDIFDLLLSPQGANGSFEDGSDGSFSSMVIDTTLPTVPRQPDNSIFIPVGAADTDSDGLADFWEEVFFPGNLAQMAASGDQDSDGLTNKEEHDTGLDPTNADSDGDGLADGVETDTGTYLSETDTGTSPRLADTDGDGISDGDEVNGATPSNPLMTDTDQDGFLDGAELATGHDPNDFSHNPSTTPIGNSETEFSGTQGEFNWQYGYRVVTGNGAITDYAPSEFTPFAGGQNNLDPWDGTTQAWDGGKWDLAASTSPWTEITGNGGHPAGPSPIHWAIRRWTAPEKQTLALRYHVHKTSTTCGGNGVTAAIYINGKLGDSVTIGGVDGVGATRTFYANVEANDVVDLILSPRGTDGSSADGCDGSVFTLVIDPTIPATPFQPNGSLFIPANASDTDGDGLPDAWEMLYADNLTTFTQTGDSDADGLSDVGEYGRDSNPTKPDTDDDGLLDLVETGTGTYVSATDTGSSPKNPDSDGDGLSDSAEVNGTPRTNPNKADTDADGFNDSAELAAGTDPNDGDDNPLTFVIANSQAEFSGVQGQNGWSNGYRNYTLDGGGDNYDAQTGFIPYPGGSDNPNPWDGFDQTWTGSAWDLNTAAAAPWTATAALTTHPNAVSTAVPEEHWTIRRWVASEITVQTPVAIIWQVRKSAAAGGGVTGALHLNGEQIDAKTIPGADTTGEIRRVYLDLEPGDIIDLALTPQGPTDRLDGSDGSESWFWVDTRLPREPRQPNGELFVPANSPDTDADGLADFWEMVYAENLTTFTGTGDNDSDGLSNTLELARDSSPLVADTDGDGLSDLVETKTGTFVSSSDTGSDPRRSDSDNDGLSDSAEVNTHGTDPNKADTDDDTFSDPSELASGHDPKDGDHNPNTTAIANSIPEFSGVQGQDGWLYGYRDLTLDGGSNNYDDSMFIEFAGGSDLADPWDGVTQLWQGTMWDLNTAAAGPWTELGAQNSHPNGASPHHWTIRRWVASELTEAQPLALRYHVRKTNGGGAGVTGALYINGVQVDSIAIAGANTTGATRTYYAVVEPGDKVDLVHKPAGPTGAIDDGADGSALWLIVDPTLPPNPTQPDGTPFNPGGTVELISITVTGGQPTLTWSSEAGDMFTIEATETFDEWTDLKTDHPSGGASTSYTDTSAELPDYRFYRILRQ